MKTYPQPGQTKFEAQLPDAEANRIAHQHYDVVQVAKASDGSGHYHSVKTLGGWVAMIGVVNGSPAILHKLPDGSRELETLVP